MEKTSGKDDELYAQPAEPAEAEDEARIAMRVRRKMLLKLERIAEAVPDEAVTEWKTQEGSEVKLFKLRDLTAAYKEVTGDLAPEEKGRDEVRVVVDL